MSELNCMLLPLTFGLKVFLRNQSLALWETPMKSCGLKEWREFQKFDFAFQTLVVSLSNLRPGECVYGKLVAMAGFLNSSSRSHLVTEL